MLKKTLFLFLLSLIPAALYGQTNYNTAPEAQTGVQPYGSYLSSDIDNVNLFNGNLNVNIPLFSLPGRELPVGVSVTYNSGQAASTYCGDDPCIYSTGGWQTNTPFLDQSLSFFLTYETCV